MNVAPLHAQHLAVARVDFHLDQPAAALQQPDLVDEFAIILFELDLDHLAGIVALDPVQHVAQRQDLAILQGLARTVVVVLAGRAQARTRGQDHGQGGAAQPEAGRAIG